MKKQIKKLHLSRETIHELDLKLVVPGGEMTEYTCQCGSLTTYHEMTEVPTGCQFEQSYAPFC